MRLLKRPWLTEYMERLKESSEAPPRFMYWCGAAIIAAAMKRHVWLKRGTHKLYPNMYTVLVGPPGAGKGAAINPAINVIRPSGTINMLSDRLTVPYILERLAKGFSSATITQSGGTSIGFDSSVLLVATELPVLLRDPDGLKDLSDLWDSREHPFDYGTRGKGLFTIDKPCVNLLGGVTPGGMVRALPEETISSGFTRRINFIYAPHRGKDVPWPPDIIPPDDLLDDLRYISSHLQGEFKFSPEARMKFEQVYYASTPGDIEDEVVSSYKSTKWVHAAKLAMALSAARCDDLVISLEDITQASVEIDQIEEDILRVFRRVGESDLTVVGDKILTLIEARGYASRSEITKAMWRHATSEDITRIMTTLIDAGIVIEKQTGNKILYQVIPPLALGGATP